MEDFQNKVYCIDNLKFLCKLPSESVDLVYIDPPFFTQRDHKTIEGVGFEDNWDNITHYIEWMKVRIREIRRILKKTGCLFLHCDVNASHRLRVMLDDVFGEKNFKNEIIWQRKHGSNAAGDSAKRLPNNHDTILFYQKTKQSTFNNCYLPYKKDYLKLFKHKDETNRGKFRKSEMSNVSDKEVRSCWKKENMSSLSFARSAMFDYKGFSPPPRGWRYSRERMEQLDNEDRLVFPKTKNGRIYEKSYLSEKKGRPLESIWTDISAVSRKNKEYRGYPTQKKEALLERIIKMGSNEGDIVADFFCGSGTTLAVAKRLGRQYIGCDSNPDAVKITKERLDEILERSSL